MIRQFKVVCMLACGFVLSVGLSQQTTWAGDEMNGSYSAARIGGQAGQSYNHVTHEHGSSQSKVRLARRLGERIGGQAGQPYDHIVHTYKPIYATGRIGGRAGASYSPIQLE